MIKINVNSNEQSALDFVKEVQGHPLLKDVVVNLNNVNDGVLYLEENRERHNHEKLYHHPTWHYAHILA